MTEPALLYGALLTQGLLWTTGHCLGMCGPLMVAFRFGASDDGGVRPGRAVAGLVAYQAGRAMILGGLGAVAGLAGASVAMIASKAMPWLALGVSTWCLLLAAEACGWVRLPAAGLPGPLARLGARAQGALRRRGWPAALVLGLGMAALPCAVVAWALSLAALSGDPRHGALLMILLVVLTTPFLLLAALLPAALARWRLMAGRWLVPAGLALSGLAIGVLAVFDLLGRGSAFCHA